MAKYDLVIKNGTIIDGLRMPAYRGDVAIRGGKIEDTVLLHDGVIENLTPTPTLPSIASSVEGSTYAAAGVLIAT